MDYENHPPSPQSSPMRARASVVVGEGDPEDDLHPPENPTESDLIRLDQALLKHFLFRPVSNRLIPCWRTPAPFVWSPAFRQSAASRTNGPRKDGTPNLALSIAQPRCRGGFFSLAPHSAGFWDSGHCLPALFLIASLPTRLCPRGTYNSGTL